MTNPTFFELQSIVEYRGSQYRIVGNCHIPGLSKAAYELIGSGGRTPDVLAEELTLIAAPQKFEAMSVQQAEAQMAWMPYSREARQDYYAALDNDERFRCF